MTSRLKLELIMENHDLKVIDHTIYDDTDCNHLLLRSLIKNNSLSDDQVIVTEEYEETPKLIPVDWNYSVLYDGLYEYKELLIPKFEHSGAGQDIYYEKENDKYVVYTTIEAEENLRKLDPIKDFEEIYSIVTKNPSALNCFWFDAKTFTDSDLITCFVKKEEEFLKDFTSRCKKGCDYNSNLEYTLTVLSAAITTIDYFLQINEWDKAQELLERVSNCGGLCDSELKENNCGCGRTL